MTSNALPFLFPLPQTPALLVLCLSLTTPVAVFAHAGHGNEFESEAAGSAQSISIDGETTERMGIAIEPVAPELMDVGIQVTGEIEALPSHRVEVTSPLPGTAIELLVDPGDEVTQGQAVAVLSSPELAALWVDSQERRAEADADALAADADLRLARENYQRQLEIAEAEIAQAQTEVAVAQEQYDRDRDLVADGAIPRRQMLESQARLADARAQLANARSRRSVLDAESSVRQAEVDLPFRDLRESQDLLAEASAALTRAQQRRQVLEAEADIQRAQAGVQVANARIDLSDDTYLTRLQQLEAQANPDGTVTIPAPISGIVSELFVTSGESAQDAGEPLLGIVDNRQVWASGNIYEKDLERVQVGQGAIVRVAGLENRLFRGRVDRIDPVVRDGQRVIPVRVELDNLAGELKPGMFAELEIATDRTSAPVLAIPTRALVNANGRELVYVENGSSFEPVDVVLGQRFGESVEVKSGLFEGDRIVTQGGMLLWAQSLRGGGDSHDEEYEEATQNPVSFPWWGMLPVAGVAAAGAFWLGRRTQQPVIREASIALNDRPREVMSNKSG